MGFLDNFRYPGFNLTAQAQLPGVFGPANQSAQIQGAIAGMVDPIVERLNKQQQDASAKRIAELAILSQQYQQPTSVTPPAQAQNTAPSTPDDLHAPLAGTTASSDPVAPGLKPHEQALLNGIAKPESGGRYDIRYTPGGGTSFAETGAHPGIYEPGPGGPSSAAGRYQFVKSTWDRVAGDAPFTRENQDIMALKLARQDYNARTGRDLDADLQQEGFSARIQRTLSPTWAGLRGNTAENAAAYNATLARAIDPRAAPTAAIAQAQTTPQPAPTASFAPQVAPAPNPAAAAAVTASPNQPTMAAPTMPLPQRGPQAQGGIPFQQPQGPQGTMPPTPQAQAPQDQQEAQQQEIIANVGRGNQEVTARLNGVRQAGQQARAQVASLSPELPGINLGGVMPGAPQPPPNPSAAYDPALAAPRPVRTTPEQAIEPPPDVPLPPPRPPAPAGPSPAAPAAAAGAVVPPPAPAANPIRVAQAAGLPPVVSDQQGMRPISDEQARAMLNAATSAEQYNAIAAMVLASRQAPKQSADRFQIIHDANGNWVRLDRLTGQTSPMPAEGSQKAEQTVEVEGNAGKQRMQWNPATRRYDIPVGPGVPGTGVPEPIRKAERELFNDFESTESVKKYRELEQGVQGLRSAFQGGNANADLVAVIQMFKAIDPGSTVTGGEYATFKNAAGIPETLRAMFNKGVGEGGQFSPELRAEIYNTAQRLQQSRVKQIEQHAEAYRRRAKAYGLDPDRTIAFDPFKFEKAKPADFPDMSRREDAAPAAPRAPVTAGSSPENRLDVPNEAAAAAQPVGTHFRLPDGRTGVVR